MRLPPRRVGGHGQCRYYALTDASLGIPGIYCGWTALCVALLPRAPRGHRGKCIGCKDLEDAVIVCKKFEETNRGTFDQVMTDIARLRPSRT